MWAEGRKKGKGREVSFVLRTSTEEARRNRRTVEEERPGLGMRGDTLEKSESVADSVGRVG